MEKNYNFRDLEKMVREAVKERFDEGSNDRHIDFLHECADGCVPIYYSDILGYAAERISLATEEPECGPAFDGSATPCNIIAANIYEALLSEANEAKDELEPLFEALEEAQEAETDAETAEEKEAAALAVAEAKEALADWEA